MTKQRTFMSIIIAAVLIGSVALRMVSILFIDFFTVLIMFATGMEMTKAIEKKCVPSYIFPVCFFPVLAFGAFYLGEMFDYVGGLNAVVLLVFAVFLVMLLMSIFIKSIKRERIYSTSFVLMYPMVLASILFALNRTPFGSTPIAMAFVVAAFSDTFAYLVGITFKGPKLAPKISPKKTISGAIGGLLGGVLGAFLVVFLSTLYILGAEPITFNVAHMIIISVIAGLFGSVFTQAGDLIASVVKRKLEIKDYGTLLGSHGGVMDRFDGQIVHFVFVYIFFVIMSVIYV